ncbi:MAG: YqjF family protein [Verrucomicrobiales bacterium]
MGEPLFYPKPTNEMRLAMRNEPQAQPVMHQTWSRLLFLHWEWDPLEIQAKLPPGLFVDTHNGLAYLGIVPFFVSDTKPFIPLLPAPGNFLELNVRTYVYDEHGRPGVWFFSLDCTSAFATHAAKFFYSLPYHTATIEAEINGDFVEYRAQRNADAENRKSAFHYKPEPEQMATTVGSLNFFLIERYLLFAWSEKSKSLSCARVYHQPYQIQKALVGKWDSHYLGLNGFKPSLKDPAHSAFAQPLRVKIYAPERVDPRPV